MLLNTSFLLARSTVTGELKTTYMFKGTSDSFWKRPFVYFGVKCFEIHGYFVAKCAEITH